MDTIECVARKAFTKFVPGYGQVHGDPEGVEEARVVDVPVDYVDELVQAGNLIDPFDEPEEIADDDDDLPPHVHDFVTGGAGGYWDVQAPWMADPVRVQGRQAANAKAAEIEAAGRPEDAAQGLAEEKQGDPESAPT